MMADDLRSSGYQGPLDESGDGKQESEPEPQRVRAAEPEAEPITFREWL